MAVICVCKVVSDELVEPDVLAAQVLPVYTNISFTLGVESVSIQRSPACSDVESGLDVGAESDLITLVEAVAKEFTLVCAVVAKVLIVSKVLCNVL